MGVTGVTGVMGDVPMGAAVACVGVAVLLWGGPYSAARRAQLLLAGGGVVGSGPPSWEDVAHELRRVRGRWRPEWWSPVVGLVVGVLGGSVLPVVAGAAGVPLLRRMRRDRSARRAGERRADAVIALCAALAGEVRSGRQPGEALQCAARDAGGLGEAQAAVLAAARFGGDVPGALVGAARQPGDRRPVGARGVLAGGRGPGCGAGGRTGPPRRGPARRARPTS